MIVSDMPNHSASVQSTFHALADPARRAMVERLSLGPATVSDLARPLSMSLPSVLQHLNVLESSGLVRSAKVGRVRTCQLNPRAFADADAWLTDRRREWERRLDRLGDYLDAITPTEESTK
jgi:DNA-binding transcriptional ArsR family regulator